MPSRLIRDGFVSSRRVSKLSPLAENLYHRLMLVVDDYGRYHGSPLTIRAACWPTEPEKLTDRQVTKLLDELLRGEDPLVRTYNVSGAIYLEIQNFRQQIRSKSKFPEPPWATVVKQSHLLFVQRIDNKSIRITLTEGHPETRFRAIQANSQEKLSILGHFPACLSIARDVYRRFIDQKVSGEWYRESPQLLDFIMSACGSPLVNDNGLLTDRKQSVSTMRMRSRMRSKENTTIESLRVVRGGAGETDAPADAGRLTRTLLDNQQDSAEQGSVLPPATSESHAEVADAGDVGVPELGNASKTPPKTRRSVKRSTADCMRVLGPERLRWFDEAWAIYPNKDNKMQGIDAFERKILDRETAVKVYRGVQNLVAKCRDDPTYHPPHFSTFVNNERWTDPPHVPRRPAQRDNAERLADNLRILNGGFSAEGG